MNEKKFTIIVTLRQTDGPDVDEDALVGAYIEDLVDDAFWLDDTQFTVEAELA